MSYRARLQRLTLSAIGMFLLASFINPSSDLSIPQVQISRTLSPTATATKAVQYPSFEWPLKWPVTRLTQHQLDEALNCDLERLASERYPYWMDQGSIPTDHPLETPCDWAVLAAAYTKQLPDDEVVSGTPLHALYRTINGNLAFAFLPKFIEELIQTY